MRKGISPIVAVVLLIAIAVIAAVGLYFWVGGLATQQPTTAKPAVISAVCQGGTIIVSNIGTTTIDDTHVDYKLADSAATAAAWYKTEACAAAPCGNNCSDDTSIASGESCVYSINATGVSGTIYAPKVGSAQFNC